MPPRKAPTSASPRQSIRADGMSARIHRQGVTMQPNPRSLERPTTKREQGEASLDRILDSALTLMVTKGFNATTVDEIARSAGLTKGAIYFHFENKTAI